MNLSTYKSRYHFSVNFYSLFLIATFIPDVLGIDPPIIKYSYWVIKVILAVLVIKQDKRSLLRLGLTEMLFVLMVLIYTLRIFIDVFVSPDALVRTGWTFSTGVIDLIGFLTGILIAFSFRYQPSFHSMQSFWFFWISLSISLILAYSLSFETYEFDVHNARYNANSTINSIMYGQTGCALALISIPGFLNNKKWLLKVVFIFTLLLGMASIAKAGSRSPIVVFIVVSIIYFIARWGKIKGIVVISVSIFLVILLLPFIMNFLDSMGSSLSSRLTSMVVDKETSGRDELYANTWRLIKDSPIFGSNYLINSGPGKGGYPHNYILEAFMATGFVGGLLFLALLIISIAKAFKVMEFNSTASWVAILYLQVIAYGMFSTGLYTSQDIWALLFLFLSMNSTIYFKKPAKPTQTSRTLILKLHT